MEKNNRFKLTRQAMFLATISAAFPVTGYCAAGRVDFAIGNVEAVAANGNRHSLNKGAEINVGETISTAAGARAQVRFADGGFISLQPNTQFRVDEFNYKNKTDGEEKGFFSLLKGGFRAITGAIGHVNKNAYQIKTSAATLGIRGTGYNMTLRDDGLFVNVGEGAISLNNNAGLLVVTAGGAAFVANANTAPVPTTQLPSTPPNGLQEPVFTVADQRGNSGNSTVLSLASGPGYAMAYAYTGAGPVFGSGDFTGGNSVIPTFGSQGPMEQYVECNTDMCLGSGILGSATATFFATDGIIGWGRWTGNTDGTSLPHPLTAGVFDYVVGIPTAVMPTGTATYRLMGYTSPTATDGSGGYSFSGSLAADFDAFAVVVNMVVANTDNTINYAVTGYSLPISGSTFSGSMIYTTGSTCSVSCSTSINGFFAGTNASRAGMSYSINNPFPGNNIQGVATFVRN